MATTIRPNQRPGKLSSKFGAAFAAFENNSGESNVPQAFRSAAMRKKPTTSTKPNIGSKSSFKPRETSAETQKTSSSRGDINKERSINADTVSGKPEQSTQSEQAARNDAELIQSEPNPTPLPVKRNFKVSSNLTNRTKMFESSSSNKGLSTTGTAAYMNARQGLRKVKKQTTVERSAQATTESTSSEPITSDKQMELFMKNVAETKRAVGIIDDELVEVDDEEEEVVEYYLEKDYSDDEYDEVWEEETLDSTEDETDEWTFQSWDEETIEDGVVVEEEEISVGAQSS